MTKEHDSSSEATPALAVEGTEAEKAKAEKVDVEAVKSEAEKVDVEAARAEAAKAAAEEAARAEAEKAAVEEAARAEAEKVAKAAKKAEAQRLYREKTSTLRPLSKDKAERYEAETGMHRDDIREIANTALINNMILSFREVSKAAAEKMENENAAGKPMNIKAKSASEGPANVFVPMPQAFGKVGTNVDMKDLAAVRHAKELIYKLEHFTEDSLESSAAKLKKGTIDPTEKHLHVARKPLLTKPKYNDRGEKIAEGGEQIYGFVIDRLPITAKDGSSITNPTNGLPYRTDKSELRTDKGDLVFAVIRNNIYYDINDPDKPLFKLFGAKAVPIDILTLTQYEAAEKADEHGVYQFVVSDRAKVKVEQPIVGDYDQFTIGLDKNYTKDSGRGETHTRYQSSLGVGTEVDIAVSVALIEGTKDRMGVQHGAEIANPYPEPLTGVTFFIPVGGTVEVVMCKNEQEILDVYNKHSDKFDLPVNPLWGWTRDDSGKLVVDPERIDAMGLAIANKHFQEHIHASEQPLIEELAKAAIALAKAEANKETPAEEIAQANQSVRDLQSRLDALQESNRHKLKLSNDLELAYRKLASAKAAPKNEGYSESVARTHKEFTDLAAQIPDSHLMRMVEDARSRAAQLQALQQAQKPSPIQPSIKEPEELAKSPPRQPALTRSLSFVDRVRRFSSAYPTLTPKSSRTSQSTLATPVIEMTPMGSASPKGAEDKSAKRPSIFARNRTLPKPTTTRTHVADLNRDPTSPTTTPPPSQGR